MVSSSGDVRTYDMDATLTSPREREPATTETILDAFEAAGLRHTRPRRAIAQVLGECAAQGVDFATEELWPRLHQREPLLGRATLFRTVDVLVDLGVLDRIDLGDGTRRYRVCDSGHHHHLVCTGCHRITEIDVCLPEKELQSAAALAGFEVERHTLELYGRCAECRAAGA